MLGLVELNGRLNDDRTHVTWVEGIFPKEVPRNMRFSINFFTSIGLGGLTDKMRQDMKLIQQALALTKLQENENQKPPSSSSDSSDSDSS